jgi:hypothetical protein
MRAAVGRLIARVDTAWVAVIAIRRLLAAIRDGQVRARPVDAMVFGAEIVVVALRVGQARGQGLRGGGCPSAWRTTNDDGDRDRDPPGIHVHKV